MVYTRLNWFVYFSFVTTLKRPYLKLVVLLMKITQIKVFFI